MIQMYQKKLDSKSYFELVKEELQLRSELKIARKMMGDRGVLVRSVLKAKIDLVTNHINNNYNQQSNLGGSQ